MPSRPEIVKMRLKLPALRLPSLPWQFVWFYLTTMLFIPMGAMLLKSTQVGWARFWELATQPVAIASYKVSFGLSLLAGLINGVAGLIIAWALVRENFPGKRFLDSVIDLPFALPTAVAGLTLASIYSEKGWVGQLFAPAGIKIAFTQTGVAIAMIFISLPFVVRTVEPVLRNLERDEEEAAWCLGATRAQTFWKVTFPQLLPAVLTGVAQGFSRAVGEYGSVVMIASNIPFRDLITPVLIVQRLEEFDVPAASVIGCVLLLFSLVFLLLINGLQAWGLRYTVQKS